jgi:hypothetical protein
LLSCPDIDGSGNVDLFIDVFGVAERFGYEYPDPNYSLLFDIAGGGSIDLFNDIFGVAERFGDNCPLIDVQVAKATNAMIGDPLGTGVSGSTPDLRNWAEASAAGYIISTQYVGQMGIHVYNLDYQAQYTRMDPGVCDPRQPSYDDTVCQLEHPVGLLYTDDGTGAPDELIGAWYLVPNQEVCDWAWVMGGSQGSPPTCLTTSVEPIGFGTSDCGNGDAGCQSMEEDNGQVSAVNQGWHDHQGLCGGQWGTVNAWVVELHFGGNPGDATAQDEQNCLAGNILPCGANPCSFFYTYGWMVHLYNLIPSPSGRFMNWNPNLP